MNIYFMTSKTGTTSYFDLPNTFNIQDKNDSRWQTLKDEIDNGDHTLIDYKTTQEYIDSVAIKQLEDDNF